MTRLWSRSPTMSSKSLRPPIRPSPADNGDLSKHRTNLLNIKRNVGVQGWNEVSRFSVTSGAARLFRELRVPSSSHRGCISRGTANANRRTCLPNRAACIGLATSALVPQCSLSGSTSTVSHPRIALPCLLTSAPLAAGSSDLWVVGSNCSALSCFSKNMGVTRDSPSQHNEDGPFSPLPG